MDFRNLTIGFDGKRAAQNRTGLGNYSRFVIGGLSLHSDIGRLLVYSPSARKTGCLDGLDKMERVEMRFAGTTWKTSGLTSLWRVAGMTGNLARDGVDLFHGLSNELPLNMGRAKGVRSIVTIHDLIFLRFPEFYSRIDRKIYDYKARRACAKADRIVAVSHSTKRDIMEFYGVAADRIDVVYQGCDSQFWTRADEETRLEARRTLGLPDRYVVYVGSIERRKNLMLLAKALRHLPKELRVVALGKRTGYADEVEDFCAREGLGDRLRIVSGAPFRLFPATYQMADALVYPSRFEGFGIPMLEALASQIPAIGCTGSSLEEAGGDASLYVAPDDDEGMARAIEAVVGDEALRRRMVDMGLAHSQGFSQEGLTKRLMECYAKTLQGA